MKGNILQLIGEMRLRDLAKPLQETDRIRIWGSLKHLGPEAVCLSMSCKLDSHKVSHIGVEKKGLDQNQKDSCFQGTGGRKGGKVLKCHQHRSPPYPAYSLEVSALADSDTYQ